MGDQTRSELLGQAIIDATELRKAALKNAEELLVKRYSSVIEESIDSMLQEEDELLLGQNQEDPMASAGGMPPADPGMGGGMDAGMGGGAPALDIGADSPMDMPGMGGDAPAAAPANKEVEASKGATDVLKKLPTAAEASAPEITITLGDVIGNPEEGGEEGVDQTDEENIEDTLGDDNLVEPASGDDLMNLQEIKDILSEMTKVDVPDQHSGWQIGVNKEDAERRMEEKNLKDKLQEDEDCDSDCQPKDITMVNEDENCEEEENISTITEAVKIAIRESSKVFSKKINSLLSENKILREERTMYLQKVKKLKDVLSESNLLNTKLYYKNQVLQDPSLNERQKNEIVEAINKTDSKEKVKTIFEIRTSFGNAPVKRAGSKDELRAILESKNYLQTYPQRKQTETDNDLMLEERIKNRAQILAGIKKDED